jgi:hypothetical protein
MQCPFDEMPFRCNAITYIHIFLQFNFRNYTSEDGPYPREKIGAEGTAAYYLSDVFKSFETQHFGKNKQQIDVGRQHRVYTA